MLNKLGIKYQILLITLIPVILVGSFFTYKHISSSLAQHSHLLHDKGQTIVRQIADKVAVYLSTGDDIRIQKLLDRAIEQEDILQASFFDANGLRIATATTATFNTVDQDDYHYFRQAIELPNLDPDGPDDSETALNAVTGNLGWINLSTSNLQLQQKTNQILIESGILFITAMLVTVLLSSIISKRISQPIFRLIEHLRQVEKGQLGKAIEPSEMNEIGALQDGFNSMTGALLTNRRHLNRRIEQATQQLNLAITDLESKNRDLGLARDLAQNANQTKSEFLANMSHEIRTPINGIKGFIGLLEKSRLEPAQRRYVDIITKSTADLSVIVDEILDFSKMESGKLNIVDEAFDLYEVLEQTRDLLFINALAKDIDLNLILFSDTPQWVIGDKLRLKQILLNLIGNAIKFTDQGRVVIRGSLDELEDEQCSILISVEDSGPGISDADQKILFQAFSQIENSESRQFTGSGLGLAISKNLAGLMGGDISINSTPGEGSCFNLKLPFRLASAQQYIVDDPEEDTRVLIFAAAKPNLMEVRTLFDRAGAITEAELIDPAKGIEPVLQSIERYIRNIDLLVFDLRHFDIDTGSLLHRINNSAVRIVVMHYDPGYRLEDTPDRVEFVSIVNTSDRIARLIKRDPALEPVDNSVAEATALQRKKVLLVDDNQVNLKLASELIRLWGHDVVEAEHATSALEIYRQQKFDVIILDIQMPDIDGVSLMHMMREISPQDSTPMVALTANVLNNEAERLLKLGFDHFLGKPIDEDKFRNLLDARSRKSDKTASSADLPGSDCSLDYARSLELAAGNSSLLQQILEILQRDIPEQRQHLLDAFDDFDLDRLGALAHKLHGVTCYASLPRLRRIVILFQQHLQGASETSLKPLVDELDGELARVEFEVDRYLLDFAD